MITYKIHLIRHGRTDETAEGLYLGRTDLALSAAGERQLAEKKKSFAYPPAQLVYTSPLQRCVQTAALLYPDRLTLPMDAFTECDFGDFTGKSLLQLKELPAYQKWIDGGFEASPPGGESGVALLSRVLGGLQEVFSRMMAERLTDAAVVTHGGVIMSLLAACGFPKRAMRHWVTDFGGGFTILLTPQMWMRDRAFEVYAEIPWRGVDNKFTDDLDILDGTFYESDPSKK
ncbi:MAG: histidine phosphatase family protein [Oscillospiraceae bacterium]|nr:histidine phosphatase family protein [Oscillospiraceae bacterium]